jgi:hypothetical protein
MTFRKQTVRDDRTPGEATRKNHLHPEEIRTDMIAHSNQDWHMSQESQEDNIPIVQGCHTRQGSQKDSIPIFQEWHKTQESQNNSIPTQERGGERQTDRERRRGWMSNTCIQSQRQIVGTQLTFVKGVPSDMNSPHSMVWEERREEEGLVSKRSKAQQQARETMVRTWNINDKLVDSVNESTASASLNKETSPSCCPICL